MDPAAVARLRRHRPGAGSRSGSPGPECLLRLLAAAKGLEFRSRELIHELMGCGPVGKHAGFPPRPDDVELPGHSMPCVTAIAREFKRARAGLHNGPVGLPGPMAEGL